MLIHWIWFSQLQGVSPREKMNYLRQGLDPEDLYHMDIESREDIPQTESLADKDLTEARRIAEECRQKGISILTFRDAAFPSRLRNVEDGPVLLYYRGTLPDLDAQPVISVVGTRKATPYGLRVAHMLARQIAACGGLIVSGGAAGADTAAMEAALDAGYPTVGVLGCGVDVVYPASNRQLFRRVEEKGCLISEYPPGTKPDAWRFPLRNRIISGISHGVLVVEAPIKSGALITARSAMEQGRDVFSVPGNIDALASAGSNALLLEGAQPVTAGWDIMQNYEAMFPQSVRRQELPLVSEKEVWANQSDKKGIDNMSKPPYSGMMDRSALSQEEKELLAYLGAEPVLMDEVIAKSQIPASKVLSMMTVLSLKGFVVMHPGRQVSAKTE